jgi:hypothetical protein
MTSINSRQSIFMRGILCLGLVVAHQLAYAASQTLWPDEDSNSRMVVENAIVEGDQTTILFWTWPDLGNPNSGKPCPLNFYSVTLRPGLPSATPTVLAKGVCGSGLTASGLLHDGDVKIIARDLLEQWHAGKRISSDKFAAIEATRTLGVTSDETGRQLYRVSPSGAVVIAMANGGRIATDQSDGAWLVTSLQPDNKKRWQTFLGEPGDTQVIERVWVGSDGSALLYLQRRAAGSVAPVLEPQLVIIGANGDQSIVKLIEMEKPFDVQSVRPGSMEDLQNYFEKAGSAKPESIESLAANPQAGGGFEVLFHRKGGAGDRAGHFIYRFAANGTLQSEIALGSLLEDQGLSKWTDFYVQDDQLMVLSKVLATQHGVDSRRTKWMQNVVSRIDLATGKLEARLIPLDERYLEAAMNAGDAGQQYLEGQPGGDPALLTSVGAAPLAVEIGYRNGHNTLRLNEVTKDLALFTETLDEQQTKLARENARQQKKADRETGNARFNDDLAAAAGMSSEDYAALSNKERKEAMVRSGNYDALMAAGAKRAKAAPAGNTQDMNARMQAAIAEAQQAGQMQGMSPEMQAQMAAAMAQVQQGTAVGGNPMPVENQTTASEFRFTVADAFKIQGRGVVITGRVDSGTVRVGDNVCLKSVKSGTRTLSVEGIEIAGNKDSASKGDRPGILVSGIATSDVSPKDELRSSCGAAN